MPEPFRAENKEAIEQRRNAVLAAALPPKSGPRKLLVLVGEVKEIAPARSGQKLVIKHLPGFPLMIDDALHRRLQARFEKELSLWEADSGSHLMAIATFGLNPAGLAIIEEIALMVVSENWIPYETIPEKRLVDTLARLREKSVKGLRYDLQPDKPIASALLQNRTDPVALFVVPAGADGEFEASLDEMIAARPEIGAWIWRVGDGEMPPLPR